MEYSHRSAKPEGTCRSAVGSKSVDKHYINPLRTRTYLLDTDSYFVLWDSPRSVFSVSQHPFPRTEMCLVPTVTQQLPLYRLSIVELAKNKHQDNRLIKNQSKQHEEIYTYLTFLYLRCFTYVPPACQNIYIYMCVCVCVCVYTT
jgi:hypothetical protein